MPDDETRMDVAEQIVDTVGSEVAVALVCGFLRGASSDVTAEDVLQSCTEAIDGLKSKQEAIRGSEDIGEANGRCGVLVC